MQTVDYWGVKAWDCPLNSDVLQLCCVNKATEPTCFCYSWEIWLYIHSVFITDVFPNITNQSAAVMKLLCLLGDGQTPTGHISLLLVYLFKQDLLTFSLFSAQQTNMMCFRFNSGWTPSLIWLLHISLIIFLLTHMKKTQRSSVLHPMIINKHCIRLWPIISFSS